MASKGLIWYPILEFTVTFIFAFILEVILSPLDKSFQRIKPTSGIQVTSGDVKRKTLGVLHAAINHSNQDRVLDGEDECVKGTMSFLSTSSDSCSNCTLIPCLLVDIAMQRD
jgi:hypothetical protein